MKSVNLKIGNRILKEGCDPYIIAEIGVNHEGDFEKAKKLIYEAKEGGADAAKFQSYKASTLASKNSPSYWDTNKEKTKSQYELFKKFDSFNEKEYVALAEFCNSIDISFLSTPFDNESIDYLYPLVPFYKIASADITNVPFLRKVAKKNKPIILSTGASNLDEINFAIKTIKDCKNNEIGLLHCILNYPTNNIDANLSMITSLKEKYPDYIIGYSDHTLPDEDMNVLTVAYLLGSQIIEKHFTDDKTKKGNDHYHAMDINDLKNFKNQLKKYKTILGNEKTKKPLLNEEISRKNARRSIVLNSFVKSGQILTEADLTYKRPCSGISTIYWDEVIGRKSKSNLEKDHILRWEDLLDI